MGDTIRYLWQRWTIITWMLHTVWLKVNYLFYLLILPYCKEWHMTADANKPVADVEKNDFIRAIIRDDLAQQKHVIR